MITLKARGGGNIGEAIAKKVKHASKEVKGAIIRGMQSAAMRGVGIVTEKISSTSPYPPQNTGQLKGSVGFDKLPDGGRIKVDAPHATFMEHGTRPHMPPLKPLVLWAVRKFGVSEKEAYPIARSVQLKISKDGIEPRHFMKNSIPEIERVMMREIHRELGKI